VSVARNGGRLYSAARGADERTALLNAICRIQREGELTVVRQEGIAHRAELEERRPVTEDVLRETD